MLALTIRYLMLTLNQIAENLIICGVAFIVTMVITNHMGTKYPLCIAQVREGGSLTF